MKKRLETVSGAFLTWERSELEQASRTALRAYLEARGFAVYSDESTGSLREAALSDFDGEKSCEA